MSNTLPSTRETVWIMLALFTEKSIYQNASLTRSWQVWQTFYLGAVISWTIHRSWPWTHTVFIVLHCIAMLMKQHSYAFYNGYRKLPVALSPVRALLILHRVSELLKRKKLLERKLIQLDQSEYDSRNSESPSSPTAIASSYFDGQEISSVHRRRQNLHTAMTQKLRDTRPDIAKVAAAVESGAPLDHDEVCTLRQVIQWEIETLDEELKGKCTIEANHYPRNLNLKDFAGYIPLPTLVYELEYPRQDHIDWYYVAEKTAATFGVLGVMLVVSQAYIYPAVMTTVHMKESGMTLEERIQEFPWILSELLFPFMMEYLLAWYVIWECIVSPCSIDPFVSSWIQEYTGSPGVFQIRLTNFPLKVECPCGTNPLRRSWLLLSMVEQHFLG